MAHIVKGDGPDFVPEFLRGSRKCVHLKAVSLRDRSPWGVEGRLPWARGEVWWGVGGLVVCITQNGERSAMASISTLRVWS